MKKFVFVIATPWIISAKVLIITHSYHRPDFIALQDKTFKKFLQDDYEFVVFNDARNKTLRHNISQTCKELHIRSIDIPQEIHDRPYLKRIPVEDYNHPCIRCANVVQYSLDVLGFQHPDIVVIFDSDMFLIQPLSFRSLIADHDIVAVPQSRSHVNYIWNGLVIFNMPQLPDPQDINFNCGVIDKQPCDAGGYTYFYLQKHPEIRYKHIGTLHSKHISEQDTQNIHPAIHSFLDKKPDNIEFLLNFSILHYRGGSNWNNKTDAYHRQKTLLIHELIDSL